MGPKATYLLLLMCVAIILTSTEAQNHLLGPIQPKPDTFCHDAPQQRRTYPLGKGYPPPRCCVTILEKIPRRILRLVSRCEIQSKYGACHIDALILHIRNKLFCAHPRLLKKLKKIHESQPGLNANKK
ncbi:C-C motif chemokine 27 [Sinocyclocheilus anshuiensis]|uniref:C-C motif chemokine 27 n=1 Tax=Sinocyclocheilus anshuiensis TaxID=1608454 RepID=UPI0007B944EB|nr:PREDICTED: C-C motif chemokine 27 [Sinocyclocheilus anshuiensis]